MQDEKIRRIFLLGLILSASLYGGVPETAFSYTSFRETTQNVQSDERLSLKVPQGEGFVVEEEKEKPSSRGGEKTLPKTPKSKAKPRREGTPPKEFVPSEKIPADQAVDFPADI
jgi:hypothetical protein